MLATHCDIINIIAPMRALMSSVRTPCARDFRRGSSAEKHEANGDEAKPAAELSNGGGDPCPTVGSIDISSLPFSGNPQSARQLLCPMMAIGGGAVGLRLHEAPRENST
jgi:hypothetical protein